MRKQTTAELISVFLERKYARDFIRFRLSCPFQTKVIITGPLRPLVVTIVGLNLPWDYRDNMF